MALSRQKINQTKISEHEKDLNNVLKPVWSSMGNNDEYNETNNDDYNNNDYNMLIPRVQLMVQPNKYDNLITKNKKTYDNNGYSNESVNSMVLFWDKVITSSINGILIWDINGQNNIDELNNCYLLTNEETYSLSVTGHNPYWLFSGHKQKICIWKYNGNSFEALKRGCTCNACIIIIDSECYGNLKCLTNSKHYIFGTSTNEIHFWKFTNDINNTPHNSNDNIITNDSELSPIFRDINKAILSTGKAIYEGKLNNPHIGRILVLKSFGDVIISGSKDGYICIWHVKTKKFKCIATLEFPTTILDLTIFPNNLHINQMNVFKQLIKYHHKYNEYINNHKQTINIKTLLSNNTNNTNTIDDINIELNNNTEWNNINCNDIKTINNNDNNDDIISSNNDYQLISVSHSHTNKLNMTEIKLLVGGINGEIHIWHINKNNKKWIKQKILRGHGDKVTALESFGKYLISSYSNGNLKLWLNNNNNFNVIGTVLHKNNSSKPIIINSIRCLLLLPSFIHNNNKTNFNIITGLKNGHLSMFAYQHKT